MLCELMVGNSCVFSFCMKILSNIGIYRCILEVEVKQIKNERDKSEEKPKFPHSVFLPEKNLFGKLVICFSGCYGNTQLWFMWSTSNTKTNIKFLRLVQFVRSLFTIHCS